jgi:transcriptional regulator with XRE-family HTH domain
MSIRGDRLRLARQQKGLSQTDLANAANTSIRQVSRYETESGDLTTETLVRIAETLNVSTDYLLGLSSEPSGQLDSPELNNDERALVEAFRRGGWIAASRMITDRIEAMLGLTDQSN